MFAGRGGGRFSDRVLGGGGDDFLIAENQEKIPPLPVTNERTLRDTGVVPIEFLDQNLSKISGYSSLRAKN